MTFHPLLMFAWALLATCFLALLVYRGQITRYEDEQLFLNDESQRYQQMHKTRLVRQLQRIEPALRVVGGAAGLVTACVVGMYVWNAWQRIQ